MRHHRARLLAVLALGLMFALGSGRIVAEEPPYAANEGPVYFIISFDDVFVTDNPGSSDTIMVNIGSLVGGSDVLDTRFIVDTSLTGITLPDGRHDPKFDDLQLNAATVLGSFYALDQQGFHSVVPAPGEVPVEIQEAIFNASNSGALDALIAKKEFPSARDIGRTITGFLPAGSPYGEDEITQHIFGSGIQLSLTVDGQIEGEGEMFPYEPNSPSIFTFEFGFDKDANFTQKISQEIPIDIQGPINIDNKSGALPVVIESKRGFDASLVDIDSLRIGNVGVRADQWSINGSGELVLKFSVPDLVADGLTTAVTTLTLRGTYTVTETDGSTTVHDFFGTDAVTYTSSSN